VKNLIETGIIVGSGTDIMLSRASYRQDMVQILFRLLTLN
jgi:hypothetical protein